MMVTETSKNKYRDSIQYVISNEEFHIVFVTLSMTWFTNASQHVVSS